MATKKDIDLSLLSVDLGNFRIGDQEGPREAYQAMIAEETEDLVNLADDIIDHGLSPAELFIVCPDPDRPKHFIVCEGNRRLTALRLLETPALAIDTPLHKRFVDLSKRYAKAPIKKVSCVIMPDKETAFLWIERKHLDLGGRGIAKWGADATSRADAFKGKIRPSRAVIGHLKDHGLLPKTLEMALTRQTTNLDRVFQMPYMAKALGVKIEKSGAVTYGSGDAKKGNDLLLRMVKAMTVPGFSVNDIRHLGDRKDFIDGFAKYAVQAPDQEPGGGTATKKTAKVVSKTGKTVQPLIDRKTLAIKGKDYVLTIKEDRLNSLYIEALRISPADLTNSAGILTRVFLELSTDHYLLKKKVPLPQFYVSKGKTKWTDMGIPLKDKIATVIKLLDPSGKDPVLADARKGLSDSQALHSVEALHEFIHKLKSDPDPKEIKRIWGRWHVYFAMLFEALS